MEDQKTIRTILIGFVLLIFGLFAAFNIQQLFTEYGWLSLDEEGLPEGKKFLDHPTMRFPILILFLIAHPVFIGMFLWSYLREEFIISLKPHRIVLETIYLALAGGFAIILTHVLRIYLTFGEGIEQDYELANYGIIVIIVYFGFLVGLNRVRYLKSENVNDSDHKT